MACYSDISSSSEDETLFITQSTFSQLSGYDTEALCGDVLELEDTAYNYTTEPGGGGSHVAATATSSSSLSDDELVSSLNTYEIQRQQEQQQQPQQQQEQPQQQPPQQNSHRFKKPLSDTDVQGLQRKQFAPTTVAKLKWAVSLFKDWQKQRNDIAVDQDISPIRVELEEMTKDELNFSISRFICEIKKRDGNEYPSDTLYSLVVCLQLHMDTIGKQHKFLNDEAFSQIKNTLDNVMKSRARNHVNVPRKQAEEITLDEEENLWNKGALGADNPKQLVNTMVYLIGARFALRGGQEHRELRFGETSQLKLGENEHGRFLKFTEDYSKANQGGLKHRKVSPKQVSAFENTICPDRCIVKLYEKYVSHRLPSNVTGVYAFYLRPLEKPKGDIWYSSQCIGRHKLSNTVADICSNAGLTGFRTNHSLRASAASRLHNAGVDEQLICEVTGHRSNAVRSYKRTSEGQKRRLSDILQGQGKKIAVGDDSRATVVEHKLSNESEAKVSLTVNITMPKK